MNKKEIIKALRPQSRLDLILSLDVINESIDVRSSVVYDYLGKNRLIIAQTTPPVRKSMIGQKIEISFLLRDPDTRRLGRYGYRTVIYDLLTDYQFRPGQSEQALVVGLPTTKSVKETSVRLHYRIQPAREHRIDCDIENFFGEVHLVDLSLGGALLSMTAKPTFNAGETLQLKLTLGDETLRLKGEAVRIFNREGSRNTFVGVKFIDPDQATQSAIQRAINRVMRTELRARAGLEEPDEAPLVTPGSRLNKATD